MELLITPAEIAELAFGGEENVKLEYLNDAVIISAQQKFIKPVFGDLYESMVKGKYNEFVGMYIKPMLAQWIKYLAIPSISAQVGVLGVVQYGGKGFDKAGDKALVRLSKMVRSEAEALTIAAVEYIEASPEKYPEYLTSQNIKHKVSILGGIVL